MEDYVHRAGRTGRAGNKGTCITFITPEQEKYSVDICRAVEASGVTPPPELKALSDGAWPCDCFPPRRQTHPHAFFALAGFLAKVRSGTAKSYTGTGFGGKGLDRFESDREAKDKAERAAFGEDEKAKKGDEANKDGEGDKAADKEEKSVLGSFKVDIVKGPAPERVGSGGGRGGPAVAPPTAVVPPPLTASGKVPSKVEAALAKINAELEAKRKAIKSGAAAAPAGPSSADTGGATRTQVPHDRKPKDPDATDFHAVVQINDFIQKARWLVTNRDSCVSLPCIRFLRPPGADTFSSLFDTS
jgi:ATP-dependent RNA helicase DDX46/PRP5